MKFRRAMRALLPAELRAGIVLLRRMVADIVTVAPSRRFSRHRPLRDGDQAHPVVAVVQEIKPSPFLAGKLANLTLGSARLDGVVLAPGETFSFWRLVGRPSARAGFALGRSIRGGVAGGDIGGGLCQLSGIVYEAGIRAGLTVIERYPHSLDLYEEQERFTPLGLDATVVWPWKDLRLSNPLGVPMRLRVAVRDLTLHAELHAPVGIEAATLRIDRRNDGRIRRVKVSRTASGRTETLSDDAYAADSFV